MKESRDARPPLDPVCRLLRTKNSFGAAFAGEWQRGESTTAVYWCLNTMEAFGPDDSYAHPHHCCAGRACFQDPDAG